MYGQTFRTVDELIDAALLDVGNASPTDADRERALGALNVLLDTLSVERGMVHTLRQGNMVLMAGMAPLEVDPFIRLERAQIHDSQGNQAFPLTIDTLDGYLAWPQGSSGTPRRIFHTRRDPGRDLLFLHPVADRTGYQLRLWYWQALSRIYSLDEELHLPPGYAALLKLNLAVALAPQYRMDLDEAYIARVANAKARIATLNSPVAPVARFDRALTFTVRSI